MDIGINEVKYMIESLESNGEVSIKEEKYLKVAKLCVQLAAENVALKQAESNLVRNIINDLGDTEFQYARVQTPATDRIVAGIKADGVDSGIQTIITMLNYQAPGVIDAINVLGVHSLELREGAK